MPITILRSNPLHPAKKNLPKDNNSRCLLMCRLPDAYVFHCRCLMSDLYHTSMVRTRLAFLLLLCTSLCCVVCENMHSESVGIVDIDVDDEVDIDGLLDPQASAEAPPLEITMFGISPNTMCYAKVLHDPFEFETCARRYCFCLGNIWMEADALDEEDEDPIPEDVVCATMVFFVCPTCHSPTPEPLTACKLLNLHPGPNRSLRQDVRRTASDSGTIAASVCR